MSFNPVHVPVGTGHQVPYVHPIQVAPQSTPVVQSGVTIVLAPPASGHSNSPGVLTVTAQSGIPARQVPGNALNRMRGRGHVPPQTGLLLVATNAQNQADTRQIPGTSTLVNGRKRF